MTLPDGLHPDIPYGYSGPPLPHNTDYLPSSYLKLSDLRTGSKRKRPSTPSSLPTPPGLSGDRDSRINVAPAPGFERCSLLESGGLDMDMDMVTRRTPQELCADCVVDCDDVECQAKSAVEKCTDQCIVVPCSEENTCRDVCSEELCCVQNCDGGNQCFGILDESLLCCTDYHGCDITPSQSDWNRTFDEFLGMNACNYGFAGCSQFPASSAGNPQSTGSISANPDQLPRMQSDSSSLSSALQERMNASFVAAPALNLTPDMPSSAATITSQSQSQLPQTHQPASNDFVCRWLGCNASFTSLNELVGHVNLSHLRPPSPSQPSKKPRLDNSSNTGSSTQERDQALPLSCHWDDCHLYPDPSTFPGPSTGLQPEMAFDLLSSHFFHDHLGLAVPPSLMQVPSVFQGASTSDGSVKDTITLLNQNAVSNEKVQPTETNILSLPSRPTDPTISTDSNITKTAQASQPIKPKPSYATPEPSPPPTTSPSPSSTNTGPPHDCTQSTHTCHWSSCGLTFPTCAALTAHLAQAHVGSGKGHYDCHWGDCMRSGAQGFASKQKIMRHLQAHTGHRPFMCKECGQHFSEAATLAQHMRRHTREKPFVCDFPGCGKAFAITGALTIHKRTHNGERPFQCPHCDRAFAESSNLSKHLRTHTGDRPYRCTVPGCGKAFARPDQLQRHGSVHAKKNVKTTSGAGRAGSSAAETPSPASAPVNGGETIVVK